MAHPLRIQRKRVSGWRMPEGAVYVGRPTIWGNPFVAEEACEGRFIVRMYDNSVRIERYKSLADAKAGSVRLFRKYLDNDGRQPGQVRDAGGIFIAQRAVQELRGKQLACWCSLDQPCHADVLCELANSERSGES